MDGVQSIPLSAFVATLLLKKRVVTAIEIVSLINEVSRNCDIYVDDDDFEIFIDNMYKYLTTELNTEFSQLKAAFIDENDTINWVNEFSQFRDI